MDIFGTFNCFFGKKYDDNGDNRDGGIGDGNDAHGSNGNI